MFRRPLALAAHDPSVRLQTCTSSRSIRTEAKSSHHRKELNPFESALDFKGRVVQATQSANWHIIKAWPFVQLHARNCLRAFGSLNM
jgi:hypothetical protein